MGREVRRVPPNWQHPRHEHTGRFVPMFDCPYEPELREWVDAWQAWDRGERPNSCTEELRAMKYWEWNGGPPDPERYRPDWPRDQMTWFQLYETVSEGTPVSPPFATEDELIDYLCTHGDFWDQKRRKQGRSVMNCDPWDRATAERFVKSGISAPSMVLVSGVAMTGVEFVAGLSEASAETKEPQS